MRNFLILILALSLTGCVVKPTDPKPMQGPPPPPNVPIDHPIRLYLANLQSATGTFVGETGTRVEKHSATYDIDSVTLGNITSTLPALLTVNGVSYTVTHVGDLLTITDNTNPSNQVVWKLILQISIG